MFVECDEVIVPEDLYNAAKSGDVVAKPELKRRFDGMTTYVHLLLGVSGIKITVRELCSVLGDRLALKIGFD